MEPFDRVESDYHFATRLRRALTERIYVVGCDPDQSLFEVQGASEMTYDVVLLPLPTCTCPDFVFRNTGTPCKHIMNVIVRVLHLDAELMAYPFSAAAYRDQVIRALDRHKNRLVDCVETTTTTTTASPATTTSVRPKMDAECAVCFEAIREQGTPTHTCVECGHRLHEECWRRWARRSATCPFCRHDDRGEIRRYLT
jgi:hypothetical protein